MVRSDPWHSFHSAAARPRARGTEIPLATDRYSTRLVTIASLTLLLSVINLACDRTGSDILNLPGSGPATYATIENQSLSITFDDLPAGADEASYAVSPAPQHGNLQMAGAARNGALAVTYMPDPGFVGRDDFTIEFRDGDDMLHSISAAVIVYPEVRFEVDILAESPMLLVQGRAFSPSGHPLPEGTCQWGFDGTIESGSMSTHASRQYAFSPTGTHVVTLTLVLSSFGYYQCSKGPAGDEKQAEVASTSSQPSDPGSLTVTPSGAFTATGTQGGPFAPSSMAFTLTNPGDLPITWTASKTQNWVTLSSTGATLAGGASTTLTVFINATANALLAGSYNDTVTITNATNGNGTTTRGVSLTVNPFGALAVTPGTGFTTSGSVGGPFSPSSADYVLTNTGSTSINWTASATGNWVTLSSAGGTLNAFASTTLTVNIDSDANALAEGNHNSTLTITNTTNSSGNTTRAVSLSATTGPLMASSVSQYGIAWTFDKPYEVGQFVNGDWWVCPDVSGGSVTIASVSPAPTGSGANLRNGSMVNPSMEITTGDSSHQAYDGRVDGFRAQDLAVFPLVLNTSNGSKSLISSESIPSYPHPLTSEPDPFPAIYRTQATQLLGPTQTALRNAAILTILPTVPPANVFRPPFVGDLKPQYSASSLRTDLLPSLAKPASAPALSVLERCLRRPWIDAQKRNWMANHIAPINNQVSYGRDFANVIGDAVLSMCVDHTPAEKQSLLYYLVQLGIDHYHAALIDQHLWETAGGFRHGRKLPILFAGLMLDDANMLNVTAQFQEDLSTYHGSSRTPDQTLWTGWASQPKPFANVISNNVLYQYEEDLDTQGNSWDHEQLPPSAWASAPFPNNPSSPQYPFDKHEGYRRLVSYSWIGHAVAARVLGLTSAWNHDPFFDYVDRWMNEDDAPLRNQIAAAALVGNWNALNPGPDWTNPAIYYPRGRMCLSQFQLEMYLNYRPLY